MPTRRRPHAAEHRTLWQVAWGIVATIAGGFVVGLLIADISSNVPLPAIIGAAVVMFGGLYCVFAPVWNWPPFRHTAAAELAVQEAPPAPPAPSPGSGRAGIRNHPGGDSKSQGSTFKKTLDVGIENMPAEGDLPGGKSEDEETTFGA